MKKVLIALAVLIAVPFALWYVAIPNSSVPAFINSGLSRAGAAVTADNFRKTLFLGFRADGVDVTVAGRNAMKIDHLRGAISPLSLFILSPKVRFNIEAAQGTVHGVLTYRIIGGKSSLAAEADGIRLAAISSIKRGMDGTFEGNLSLDGARGKLTFEMAGLSNFPYGFTSANGLVRINGGDLKLESISLESALMYAKVKGDIKDGRYNVVTEIMKQPASLTASGTAGTAGTEPSLDQSLGNFLPSGKMTVPASGTIQGLF